MSVFHYRNADGTEGIEVLTPEQARDDVQGIKAFETLESLKDVNSNPELSARFFDLIKDLPPQRKAHHMQEATRIGLKDPRPKPKAKAVDPAIIEKK